MYQDKLASRARQRRRRRMRVRPVHPRALAPGPPQPWSIWGQIDAMDVWLTEEGHDPRHGRLEGDEPR